MRVEVEFYEKGEKDRLIRKSSLPSGDSEFIKLCNGNARIAVFCSLDSKKGSVIINDPEKKIDVLKFKDKKDRKGEKMDINSLINIEKKQKLSITNGGENPSLMKISVYLSPDNSPQKNFAENPFDPPLTAA
jgi:hypothetical protein